MFISPIVYLMNKDETDIKNQVKLALLSQGYTADARGVRTFQKEHGLLQDGIVGIITYNSLLFYK